MKFLRACLYKGVIVPEDKKYHAEYPFIKKLQIITRAIVTGGFIGGYRSVFKGRGLEFEGYREYTETDDADLIDWKASLRTGQTLIKEFGEEREVDVVFLMDVGSSMIFGSTEKLKNEYAAELVACLTYAILEAGDSTGLVMFSDKINARVVAKTGHGQFYNVLHALANPSHWGGGCDIIKALRFAMSFTKKGGLIIIISDFIGFKGPWERYMRIARANYDVIGMMVRDVRDKNVPEDVGQVMISDPYSNKQMLIDTSIISDKFRRYVSAQERNMRQSFISSGCDFLPLETDKSFVTPILKFFKERARRWT